MEQKLMKLSINNIKKEKLKIFFFFICTLYYTYDPFLCI